MLNVEKLHEYVILEILQKDIPGKFAAGSLILGLLQSVENTEEHEMESYRFNDLWQSFLAAKYLASVLSERKVQHASNA